jgi:hypothetical protein
MTDAALTPPTKFLSPSSDTFHKDGDEHVGCGGMLWEVWAWYRAGDWEKVGQMVRCGSCGEVMVVEDDREET